MLLNENSVGSSEVFGRTRSQRTYLKTVAQYRGWHPVQRTHRRRWRYRLAQLSGAGPQVAKLPEPKWDSNGYRISPKRQAAFRDITRSRNRLARTGAGESAPDLSEAIRSFEESKPNFWGPIPRLRRDSGAPRRANIECPRDQALSRSRSAMPPGCFA
jgi:hypothetical protein